jgi:hypothetical protein
MTFVADFCHWDSWPTADEEIAGRRYAVRIMSDFKLERRQRQLALVDEILAVSGWSLGRLTREAKLSNGQLSKLRNDPNGKRNVAASTEDRLRAVLKQLRLGTSESGFESGPQEPFLREPEGDRPGTTATIIVPRKFLENLQPGEGPAVTIRPHRPGE